MPPPEASPHRASWDVVSGPGLTALGLAASRLVESGRPDRLIDDKLGAVFLAAVDSPVPFPTAWPRPTQAVDDQQALHLHGSRYIGLRTRFYDDVLRRATEAGIRQMVLLAAGLDTRALRLGLPPDVRLFELDQPQVLAFKDDVLRTSDLTATCERLSVGVDLREDWTGALRDGGFDATRATAWVAEGLLAYLAPKAERLLIERITELSAGGSRFAADQLLPAEDDTALRRLSERSGLDMSGLIDTSAREGAARVLERLGWSATEESVGAAAERYGRDLSDPFARDAPTTPPWLDTEFLIAELRLTAPPN